MSNEYNYYNPNPGNINDQPGNDPQPVKPKKKRKMPKGALVICFALLFGIVGGTVFQATNFMVGQLLGTSNQKNSSSADATKTIPSTQLTKTSSTVVSDVSKVVDNVMPSVVSITNMSVQQVQNFFGGVSEQEMTSSGSGIIIGENDKELLIVTNNHVVSGSDTLTVTFNDEKSVEASVKGTDAKKDLAVVAVKLDKIESSTKDVIKVATLGDSGNLKVGEPAIAIGNALGYGQSVTTGVISATNREIEMEGFDSKLIQTDAAINPGNSGGALMNANGEVIGINTVKVSDSTVEGMGYAIPISDVSDVITGLMNKETREKVAESEKGYLGIRGVDVTEDSAQMYNMPKGVYVSEAVSGGAAAKAKIQKGYIITAINGENIANMTELQGKLEYYAAGEEVELTVQVPGNNGDYKEQTVKITLTKNVG